MPAAIGAAPSPCARARSAATPSATTAAGRRRTGQERRSTDGRGQRSDVREDGGARAPRVGDARGKGGGEELMPERRAALVDRRQWR